ncbi:RidA family protein [Anaerosphaera multitolerans]|uniref:RidA family protein n=1 Tax=Anaerosphaera multitolerans TaxID=2487351 RepID=A0A437S4S8_9FIRM|nr:Rid family detoxifying hydrolase [Anaerosphaera multitolerans]RVU53957.1 RidA family protein [Anaerosphaera multitolerans]
MSVEFVYTHKAPEAIGPYSQGTEGLKGAKVVFTSGQLPMKDGELQTDAKKATEASLSNVLAIVEAAGGKLQDIAKVNVFVTNIEEFDEINKAYADFFGDHKPARSLVEVSKLPKGAVLEIEAVALVNDNL